jgi:NifU-like protein involved in Fe-S cluster formation/bacterioferritin-associated ferredoxin
MKKSKKIEIISSGDWFYSPKVKEHFFHPKNFLLPGEEKKLKANGIGMIGSPACGDIMRVWLVIDSETERIKEFKWQTFGCASAIASTSMLSVMTTEEDGMEIEKALKIKPQDIIERLGGLPAIKYHCSVLGDKALRDAINDYFRRTGQIKRIQSEGSRIIDPVLKITDYDIEKAVIEGATTLEDVQKKTKVGLGDKSCLPEVEELIRFYQEKYNL